MAWARLMCAASLGSGSWDVQHDVAGRLPALNRLVGGDRVGQREGLRHVVDELAALEHVRDLGGRALAQLRRHQIDQEEPQSDAVLQQELEGDRDFRQSAAVDRDGRVRREHVGQEPSIGGEIDLHRGVGAAPAGDRLHARADILALVVDNVVGARLMRERGLLRRAHRGDDLGLAPFGELDGVVSDRARAGGDQHRRAILDTSERDRLVGGIGRNAETRAGVHRRAGRQRHRLCGRHGDEFGSGTEGAPPLPVPDPDAFAHAGRGDAVADSVDLAGAVAVRDHAWKRDLARHPGAAFHVGRVDAGCGEAHAHLAGAGLRRLHLVHAQHGAGRPVGLVIGSTHQASPFRLATRPGLTSSMSARLAICANAAPSAPVMKAWAPSRSSSS